MYSSNALWTCLKNHYIRTIKTNKTQTFISDSLKTRPILKNPYHSTNKNHSGRCEQKSLQNRVALAQKEDNTEEALTSAAQTEKSTGSQKNGPDPVSTRGRDWMRQLEMTRSEQTGK
jgi:hypothetical protein